MKIIVDHNSCSGHARCWAAAQTVYPLDEEGYSAVWDAEVPAGLEQQARDGAAACPELAITVIE